MGEALDYLAKFGWSSERLYTQVFEVSKTTFSSWVTGQVEMDARTKKTFHHDVGIRLDFWTDEDLSIEQAITHTPRPGSSVALQDPSPRIILRQFIPSLRKLLEYADRIEAEGEGTNEGLPAHTSDPSTAPANTTRGRGAHEPGKMR